MKVGLDFDNTLICYDSVFSEIALEHQIQLSRNCSNPKRELQAAIRKQPNGEITWTEIQASAYGPKLSTAKPFPGLIEKLQQWKDEGHQLYIVSHKTQYPTLGPLHDLRAEASEWIKEHLSSFLNLSSEVFFESTQQEKLSRIASLNCDVFIDDLPEIIDADGFPPRCTGILFAPGGSQNKDFTASWETMQLPEKTGSTLETIEPARVRDLLELLPDSHRDASFTKSKLSGGINSKVSLLQFSQLPDLVLKEYPNDNRSRLERESSFLNYTSQLAKANTPRLIASDPSSRRCVMTNLQGETFNGSDDIETARWVECLDFLELLQTKRETTEAQLLSSATDAGFSLQAHLGITTRRRNQCASAAKEEEPIVLSDWILNDLEKNFQELARSLIANPEFKKQIDPSEKILSPSDFGLHNAMQQEDQRLAFFDFEYAGWDDPAKTWSDFFLQPRFPAPRHLMSTALSKLSSNLSKEQKAALMRRIPYIFACCSLNWIYIILNHRWNEATTPEGAKNLIIELSARASETLSVIREPEQFRESTL